MTLSKRRLELEIDVHSHDTTIANLQAEVATLKNNKSTLQKNHDELVSAISTNDKELKDVNECASAVVTAKATPKEEMK